MVPLLLALAACSSPDEPAWALDSLWLEPDAQETVYGFHTWELYAERWKRKQKDKHFICSVVVEVWGTPSEPSEGCLGCTHAWSTEVELLETDCADDLLTPRYLSLQEVGLGELTADLAAEDPFPGQSVGGWARYGDEDVLPHGFAYPATLDEGGQPETSDWDGVEPFTWWPAWAWDLDVQLAQ